MRNAVLPGSNRRTFMNKPVVFPTYFSMVRKKNPRPRRHVTVPLLKMAVINEPKPPVRLRDLDKIREKIWQQQASMYGDDWVPFAG